MAPKIPKNLRLHQRKKRTDLDTKHVLEGEVNTINAALRQDLSVLTAAADPEIVLIRKGIDPDKVAATAVEREEREAAELEQRGLEITAANRSNRDRLSRNTEMVDDFLEPTTFYREPRNQYVGVRKTMFRIRCIMCDGIHFTSLMNLTSQHTAGRIQTCACTKGREITRTMKAHMLEGYVLDGEPRTRQDKVVITCPNGHVEHPSYNNFMKKVSEHPDKKFECKRCAGTDKRFKEDT
jgi:hypothetical protein